MSRKRKEATAEENAGTEIAAEAANTNTVPVAAIVSDVAAEGVPVAMPVHGETTSSLTATPTSDIAVSAPVVTRPESATEEKPEYAPDPFDQASIRLTDDPKGPVIRLQRSQRYRQMRIQLDEKPESKYLQMFREAGMKWRGQDQAWSIQLDRDAPWRTALDIEKLFFTVGNAIREENGLRPIQALSL